MKNKVIWISVGVVLLIMILYLFFFLPKSSKKIPSSKFSETELKWIQSLSKSDQNYFYETESLHSILKEKTFQAPKFSKYLAYYKKHPDFDFYTLILIVNHNLEEEEINDQVLGLFNTDKFEPSRLKRYIAYEKENPDLDLSKVVSLVNQDIDEITMKYDDNIELFMNQKYFIKENLERYINYKNQNKTNIALTVSYVNSNLDYEFYTNVMDVDLSKGIFVLVNKYYMLPSDYVPTDLVLMDSKYGDPSKSVKKEVYEAFQKMADDAAKENLNLWITSSYRSFEEQTALYNDYSNANGVKKADTYYARPGYSEHQTGLSIDIVSGMSGETKDFSKSKEFTWMKAHAHEYGFILRYSNNTDSSKKTGYQYEPWHYRYVGVEVASQMNKSNLTYEEYYAYYIK